MNRKPAARVALAQDCLRVGQHSEWYSCSVLQRERLLYEGKEMWRNTMARRHSRTRMRRTGQQPSWLTRQSGTAVRMPWSWCRGQVAQSSL